jgi:hypothetical protein
MNKNLLTITILMIAFVAPAIADKPEWAGKGKPTAEQKAAHKSFMNAKEDLDDEDAVDKLKKEKEKKFKKDKEMDDQLSGEVQGLEKQKLKKSEQTRKEMDKGSDEGKESRAENTKKWWSFWE